MHHSSGRITLLKIMRGGGLNNPSTRLATVLVLALLVAPSMAKPGGRPGTKGTYDLIFTGEFKGTGSAKVNPVHLNITAELTGITGPGGTLQVKNLRIDDGRFDGSGTLNGQPAKVYGRIDAAEGGVVTTARLSLTIVTDDGRVARGFGQQTVKDD